MSELVETYHRKFWETLSRNQDELDAMLGKLYHAKGIPKDRTLELTHTLYVVAASKFCNYDDERSSFTTWMIMWAKALLTNYYRNSAGSRSPLSADLTEGDLPLYEDGDTAYDNVGGGRYRDRLDISIAIEDVLMEYDKNVRDFDHFSAVFDTLIYSGFDVSCRVIAYEVEISPQLAWDIKSQILSELAFMLRSRGIDKPVLPR